MLLSHHNPSLPFSRNTHVCFYLLLDFPIKRVINYSCSLYIYLLRFQFKLFILIHTIGIDTERAFYINECIDFRLRINISSNARTLIRNSFENLFVIKHKYLIIRVKFNSFQKSCNCGIFFNKIFQK